MKSPVNNWECTIIAYRSKERSSNDYYYLCGYEMYFFVSRQFLADSDTTFSSTGLPPCTGSLHMTSGRHDKRFLMAFSITIVL